MADAAEITKSAEQTLSSSSKNHNDNINNNNNNSYSNNKRKSKNKKKSASAASNNSHDHCSGVDVGIGIGVSITSTSPHKNGKVANVGDGGIITSSDSSAAAVLPLTNGDVNVLLEQLHINGHTNGQEPLEYLKNYTNCSEERDSGGVESQEVLNIATNSKAKSKHKNVQQYQQQQKTEKHCHETTNNIREQVQKEKNLMEILSNGHDADATAIALALNQLLDLKSADAARNVIKSSSASNTCTGAIPKVKLSKSTAKQQQTESMMANTTKRSSAATKEAVVNAESSPVTNSEITMSTLPVSSSISAGEGIEENQSNQGAAITNNNQNNKNKHNKTCSSATTIDSYDNVKVDDKNNDDKVHNNKASTATETITTITTTITDIKATDIIASPPLTNDERKIEYMEYEAEYQMHDIMRLIQAELSEPYSIYTYRYFIYNWPKLCFLARHGNEYVGAIVCKLDMHMNVRRGYIAMLAVRKEYRKLKIGTTLVQKAIEAMLADNADEVVLETEMRNLPALRLYENLGFVRDKRLFRYYLNGVDALRLKLWFR